MFQKKLNLWKLKLIENLLDGYGLVSLSTLYTGLQHWLYIKNE